MASTINISNSNLRPGDKLEIKLKAGTTYDINTRSFDMDRLESETPPDDSIIGFLVCEDSENSRLHIAPTWSRSRARPLLASIGTYYVTYNAIEEFKHTREQ